jgi:hypothetical protein
LGLELTDRGYNASVSSELRSRLVTGGGEDHLLDTLLALCRERKLPSARGQQCTDSTHELGTVCTPESLECVTETLRAARVREVQTAFSNEYQQRAGIEGAISAGVRALHLRRSHSVGLTKTHLKHVLRAAAMNLIRLGALLAKASDENSDPMSSAPQQPEATDGASA